jgi:AraC-like DNA-binding protein
MSFTTLASLAGLLWRAMESYGVEPEPIFEQAGLDPRLVNEPGGRYATVRLQRLWRLARDATGDPCFGFTAAECWHPTSWHALGYAWLASRTLHDAFERTVRHSRVLATLIELELREGDDTYTLILRARDPSLALADVSIDASLAMVVKMCRTSYGESFAPREVMLPLSGRDCDAGRRAYFRAPIRYEASDMALVMGRPELEAPLSTSNAELVRTSEESVRAYLMRLDRGSLVEQVKLRLSERLPAGQASAEAIADELHMSPRTLQRKLRERGKTYRDVLEETRRELAEQYIQDPTVSINEITFLLGFSEPSSFTRAFRRWRGTSPTAYRDTIRG